VREHKLVKNSDGKPEFKRPLGKSRGGWEDDKEIRL
jgi:hypothetical protein